jgi:hypothetical protein
VPIAQQIGETNVSLLGKVRDGFKEHARLTLDLDSHVETVYGKQQRAKSGYPRKPGGFHPLLCFIGETRDFLWGKFRPGNRYASQGAVEFLKECLKRLSCGMKAIFLRADSAFFDNKFLSEVKNHLPQGDQRL